MSYKLIGRLILIAFPGAIAVSWWVLPSLLDASELPVPMRTVQIVSAVQSFIIICAAATAGGFFGRRVGLRAPLLEANTSDIDLKNELQAKLFPCLVGAVLGAVIIVAFYAVAPDPLVFIQQKLKVPLIVRVLYGGITEEVLIRWGLMTLIAWCVHRVIPKSSTPVSPAAIWIAIVFSSVAFGLAHLPTAAALLPQMSINIAIYITIGNSLFGVIAGYLFWRHGIETAMGSHIFAHVLAYFVHG